MQPHHCHCLFLLCCITALNPRPSSPHTQEQKIPSTDASSMGWNEDERLWSSEGSIVWTKLNTTKLTSMLPKLMMPSMVTSQGKLERFTFPEQKLTSCFLDLWTGKLMWSFTISCCTWKWRAVICFSEIHIFKIILWKYCYLQKNSLRHIKDFCYTVYASV